MRHALKRRRIAHARAVFALAGVEARVAAFGLGIYSDIRASASFKPDGDMHHVSESGAGLEPAAHRLRPLFTVFSVCARRPNTSHAAAMHACLPMRPLTEI